MTTIPKWTAENTPKAYQDLVTPGSDMFVEADKTDTTKDPAAPKTYLVNAGDPIKNATGELQAERDMTGYMRMQEGKRLVTNLFTVPVVTIFRIVEVFSLYHFWPCNELNPRKNKEIRAEQVSIINSDGSSTVLSLADALKMAQDTRLDLVEVSSEANPPTCKIVDYHAYCREPANVKSQEYQLLRRVTNFAKDIALIVLSPLFLVIHEIVALVGVIFPDLTRSVQSWLEETVLQSNFCENMKLYCDNMEMRELEQTFKAKVVDEKEKPEEKKETKTEVKDGVKNPKDESVKGLESSTIPSTTSSSSSSTSEPTSAPVKTATGSDSSSSSSSSLSSSSSSSSTSEPTSAPVKSTPEPTKKATASSSSSSSSSSLSSSSSSSDKNSPKPSTIPLQTSASPVKASTTDTSDWLSVKPYYVKQRVWDKLSLEKRKELVEKRQAAAKAK